MPGYRGNPQIECVRPECTHDGECSYNLACSNEKCRDPCNCGENALCRVDNHRASCRCPPGYSGDSNVRCSIIEKEPECRMDGDCPSKLACFSGMCKNPCYVTKPCAEHASCSVVDTLPLRTMVCTCDPGYVGDAEKQCKLGKLLLDKIDTSMNHYTITYINPKNTLFQYRFCNIFVKKNFSFLSLAHKIKFYAFLLHINAPFQFLSYALLYNFFYFLN